MQLARPLARSLPGLWRGGTVRVRPGASPRPPPALFLVPALVATAPGALLASGPPRRGIAEAARRGRPLGRAAAATGAGPAALAGGADPVEGDALAERTAPPLGFSSLFAFVSWPKVVCAWACTLAAVGCLLLAVPRLGQLTGRVGAGDVGGMLHLSASLVGLFGLRALAMYLQDVWLWETAIQVTRRARERVFSHLLDLELANFAPGGGAAEAGDLTYRLTAEAEKGGEMVFALLQRLVPGVIQLVAMLGKMIVLSPALTASTVAIAPAMAAVIGGLGAAVRSRSRVTQDRTASLSAYLGEILPLPAAELVRSHGTQDFERSRLGRLTASCAEARASAERTRMLLPAAITVVYALTVCLLLAAGCCAIARGSLTGEGMVSFLSSLVLLIEPIQGSSAAYNEIKQGEAAVERLLEPLSLPAAPVAPEAGGGKAGGGGDGGGLDVEVEDVHFRYRGSGRPALDGLSLRIRAGETAALVGASGSGKSTVARLLLGLYAPQRGRVLLGGLDLASMGDGDLRRRVALVGQDALLLSGSVADNVAYGAPDPDAGAVRRAARLADAASFVEGLRGGYDADVGAGGVSLSGGQRQRLAIARAVYRDPRVLVLDEATSALDNTAAATVGAALREWADGRTVVVVAHRMELAREADVVFVIEQGRVAERGTHDELLARGGQYAALYRGGGAAVGR